MRVDRGMGLRFKAHMEPDELTLIQHLPEKIRTTYTRRAMRRALSVFLRLAQPLYRRHRSDHQRKHLDESLFIITRRYRNKGRQPGAIWGAMGFRVGAAGRIGGVKAVSRTSLYENDWAGWRAHFLERGFTATGSMVARDGFRTRTKRELGVLGSVLQRLRIKKSVELGEGRRIPGKEYLPRVFSAGSRLALEHFRASLINLIRTRGRSVSRMPRNLNRQLLDSELRELTRP